jgi:phosphoserine phosphatase
MFAQRTFFSGTQLEKSGLGMGFRLVVFDLDGTLTTEKSVWEYIHQVLGTWKGHAEEFQKLFLDGRISYSEFCERDAGVWKGMRVEDLRQITDSVPYHEGAFQLKSFLKEKGFKLAAISSGLSLLGERIGRDFGLDFWVANELVVNSGIVTGKVAVNVPDKGKGHWLRKVMKRLDVKGDETIAVGDSQGDLEMLALSGFSIAFNSSSFDLDRAADLSVKTGNLADLITRLPV